MNEMANAMNLQRYLNACINTMWSDADYYLSFLRTSAQMYKYNFQDQVLIHDSRPDAVACAESKTWCNDDIHRAINEGARAIPLITTNNGAIGLRFVYDYADTKAIDERSKSPMFWQVRQDDEKVIQSMLGYSVSDNFADSLLNKAHEIVLDQSEVYHDTLLDNVDDTFLEELDEYNIKMSFDKLLEKSVAYMVLLRCGIAVDAHFEKNDFKGIYEFNSVRSMSVLGAAVSDLSEQILRSIERTVKAERRKENEISRNNDRENSLRTENSLQLGRADENIHSGSSIDATNHGREIRDNADELSQTAQQGELSSPADNREAKRASVGDRQDGTQPIGADDTADDDKAGRDRATEITGSDEVDRSDEQHKASGGGDSPKRTDLQLNNLSAELNGSASSMPNYLIDGILKADKFFKIKREEVVEFFLTENDSNRRTEFMKTVFNDEYSEFDVGDVRCGYKSWDEGLEMWSGHYMNKSEETRMSWESVARRVGELIEAHEYLIDDKTFDIEPEIEEMGGYDDADQLTLFDINVQSSDIPETVKENTSITAYRMGDFYEFYGEDARIAADVLDISLTSRNGEPMTGVPAHALDKYKAELLNKGYTLTIEEARPKESTKAVVAPSVEPVEEHIVSEVLGMLDMTDTTAENVYDRITELLADMLFGEELTKDEEIIVNELLNDDDAQFLAFEPRLPDFLQHDNSEKETNVEQTPTTEAEQLRLIPKPLTKKELSELEKLTAKLTDEFARWEKVVLDGGSDAFYEDGVSLELLRNHIISYKNEISEKYPNTLPEIFHRETPPEYPRDYQSVKKGDTLRFDNGDFLVLSIEKTNEYTNDYSVDLQAQNGDIITQNLRYIKTKFQNLTNRGEIPSRADELDITNIPSDLDKFYVDKENEIITQVYYNPDSSAGGQLVYNRFSFEDLATALEADEPLEYIESIARQELIDVDDPAFSNKVREFLADTEDFNSGEKDIFAKLSAILPKEYPTITCEWSESSVFEDGKTYTVYEFDRIMKQADDEHVAGEKAALEKYGTHEKWYNAEDDEFTRFMGYDKVKFTVNMPDGTHFTERQDIGDGFGGVIDFLSKYPHGYGSIIPILEQAREATKPNLDRAKSLIDDFCEREYQSDADYTDLTRIGIAHTEDEDTELPIEVYVDLETYRIVTEFNKIVVSVDKYNSLDEMCERALDNLNFDDLVYLSEDKRAKAISQTTEAPQTENYRADQTEQTSFGQKSRYTANIAAIKTLLQLERENRAATPDEQKILAQYVGWGGIPQAFDSENAAWSKEYTELKELLTPDEYESARGSVLNAHYTSSTVINAIYKALENMGFKSGNVLEPAMGVGNFFANMPENLRESTSLYGVELDSITGRIAQHLYPKANVQVTGYEQTSFPDNFFDVAIGNVPFGSYGVVDKRYDKENFMIHDYFFAKTLDAVAPGGVVAFVTSKGTLDKVNTKAREYIAKRADLVGAIRLPNNAFKANANTEVTSDIIFLQKREEMATDLPDWVHTAQNSDGITVNRYFIDHPNMMLGTMSEDGKLYGGTNTTCVPFEGADLKAQLDEAVKNIQGEISVRFREEPAEKHADSLLADPNTRNFSFTVVNGNIYYRENGEMFLQDLPKTTAERVKGMIEIRDCVRKLIDLQLNDYSDEDIKVQQAELNRIYDKFTSKYGLLNATANSRAFSDDSSAPLLNSLEILTEDGKLQRKADMFTKRTIKQRTEITHTDTAMDALAVSISEKARVDMPFMEQLTGKSESEIVDDLKGVIYRIPTGDKSERKYATADEYLSGNIREKLLAARLAAEIDPDVYGINISALKEAMPKPLEANEIDVRLGATWIDTDTIKQFIMDTIQPAAYMQNAIKVSFSEFTAEWNIEGKNYERNNVLATMTYGTERKNALSIIEDTLNLRDARVYDRVEENGKTKYVLNHKETTLAQEKQEAIKQAFKDWIFRDPERRERLVTEYNKLFNSIRPREYDGSHLNFVGMSPEIQLRPHQLNAIAHTIYGGNTLLAHKVGAGKTFEMVASAMESKRLGLCSKSLFAVPNHLTEQMGAEFMRLYPSANILVATAKDFERNNRKRLISKIATGNYDAIIIGHSQLKKIPLSQERQENMLRHQIDEITKGIQSLSKENGQRFSVKQLAKTQKNLEARLKKLLDTPKDDVVTFEELGVDKMYIDEAHEFKNLFLYTKMRNVAGISTTDAEKSSDLYMKCQYLDELTGGKGIVFATGTPISNTMSEMYTMMRYLQANKLKEMNMQNFDAWAANFGEPVTAIELAPEGTGYRAKTRFSRFFNLPELMNIFKEAADIKTADDLNLDVPNVHYHNIVVKPSEIQKEMIESLSVRAAAVHNKMVDPETDNMLKITNDGRKIGLDQRLINPSLPDDPNSKVNACVNNVFDTYTKTAEKKSTQLVFCDFSIPKKDGSFNLYDDIRSKLIAKGVAEEEIAFIHDANTEVKKEELFAKVRSGTVRVLIGSTAKCGAGTNIQDKLAALHHLDCPWRPSDLEQRDGRIARPDNENADVDIYRYVTEGTFDAYLYQTIETKQRFVSQIMTSKSPVRSCEDIDEATLSYAEVKALCAGNPLIKEKMDLDVTVSKLKMVKSNFMSQQYRLEDKVLKELPQKIHLVEGRIKGLEKDVAHLHTVTDPVEGISPMMIGRTTYTDKEQAGKALLLAVREVKSSYENRNIGSYKGFNLMASYNLYDNKFTLSISRESTCTIELSNSDTGNITRIDNALASLENGIENNKQMLDALNQQLATAKSEMGKPFPQEQELAEKMARLNELNVLLNMDDHKEAEQDNSVVEDKPATAKKLSLDERIDNVRKQRSEEAHSTAAPAKKKDQEI